MPGISVLFVSMQYQRRRVEDKAFDLAWMAPSLTWKGTFEHKVFRKHAGYICVYFNIPVSARLKIYTQNLVK